MKATGDKAMALVAGAAFVAVTALVAASLASLGQGQKQEQTGIVPANAHIVVDKLRREGSLTNVVQALLATGEACKVRGGHAWAAVPAVFPQGGSLYDNEPGDLEMRRCVLCGKAECRKVGRWQ